MRIVEGQRAQRDGRRRAHRGRRENRRAQTHRTAGGVGRRERPVACGFPRASARHDPFRDRPADSNAQRDGLLGLVQKKAVGAVHRRIRHRETTDIRRVVRIGEHRIVARARRPGLRALNHRNEREAVQHGSGRQHQAVAGRAVLRRLKLDGHRGRAAERERARREDGQGSVAQAHAAAGNHREIRLKGRRRTAQSQQAAQHARRAEIGARPGQRERSRAELGQSARARAQQRRRERQRVRPRIDGRAAVADSHRQRAVCRAGTVEQRAAAAQAQRAAVEGQGLGHLRAGIHINPPRGQHAAIQHDGQRTGGLAVLAADLDDAVGEERLAAVDRQGARSVGRGGAVLMVVADHQRVAVQVGRIAAGGGLEPAAVDRDRAAAAVDRQA